MSRAEWEAFICDPLRAGRHLSSIGRGVQGAAADPIDLAELQAFLDRLHDAERDGALLAEVVDLLTGGYLRFAQEALPKLLDSLSNEVRSQEEIVGPGLRGQPRWDRTIVARANRRLMPGMYISRTSHRSFELPENQTLRWLVDDLWTQIDHVVRVVGTKGLHDDLMTLHLLCSAARDHDRLRSVVRPSRLSDEMVTAAERHRLPAYRMAGKLARRRRNLHDRNDRLHNMLQLLAVNWLRPVNENDLFELFGLVLCLDVIADELAFGAAEELGLVMRGRRSVASFRTASHTVKVYFDQNPNGVLGGVSRFATIVSDHEGLAPSVHRPDILIVVETGKSRSVALIDMKNSADPTYIDDSVYKMMGYLYDFQDLAGVNWRLRGVLIFPSGFRPRKAGLPLTLISGSDRTALADCLRSLM